MVGGQASEQFVAEGVTGHDLRAAITMSQLRNMLRGIHRTPDGFQRLLNRATWEADAVRNDLQAYVAENLGEIMRRFGYTVESPILEAHLTA